MLRFAAAAAATLLLLSGVKEHDLLDRAGLLGTCKVVATPLGSWGEWWACRDGRVGQAPDLSTRACTAMGRAAGHDYWRCPAPLRQDRAAG